MEDYEIVEQFAELWKRVPKSLPLVSRKEARFALFLPVGGLRVYVALTVGRRGGISEEVLVVDPSEAIVADRLLVNCYDGDWNGKGAILPLSKLRQRVRQATGGRRDFALQICEDAMWDFLDENDDHPLDPARLRRIQSTSESIKGLSGGAPSLGKRGGGAPGSH